MQKAKDAGYIVKLHIVYTDSDKDAAEMIVVESVISKSAAAGDAIDSTGDYDFVGSIIIEDNNVTASGSNSYVNATDGVTKDYIADLARFLGALYRTSGAEEIKFDGKTYNWNTDGTLQGSNWTENGVNDNSKSLVKAIDTKLGVLEAGDSVEITLTVGWQRHDLLHCHRRVSITPLHRIALFHLRKAPSERTGPSCRLCGAAEYGRPAL